MIAFLTGNALDGGCFDFGGDFPRGDDGRNFILSVKSSNGYCISKILVTSIGIPRQMTIIMVFDSQADIVAVPELYSSVYVPWRSARRVTETAQAFINAGICEQISCCAAIAVNIVYDVIDRDYVDYSGSAKDCLFTSSGAMELNEESKERIFSGDYVVSDFSFEKKDGETPF